MPKPPHSQCRGPGLIPGQGTRSHMWQLRVCMPQLKILCATTKTWCSQINIKKKSGMYGVKAFLGNKTHTQLMLCCAQSLSCVQLCDPIACSLPGSSVHGILQARILEWVAVPFSRGSSQSRDQTQDFPHCRQNLYCLSHQESHTQLSVVYSSLLNSQLLRWICGRDSLSKNIPCHSPPGPKQSVLPCLSPHLLPYRLPKVPETRQGSPCLRAFAPAVLSAQSNLPSIPRKWQLLIHPASLKCHLLREAFPDTPPFVAASQPR